MFHLTLANPIRFLWVHFQIIELCDAASDEGIRDILEHLPEGLYETYTRIVKKIAKTGYKTTALKVMMWMVCSRRLLRVEELQEAVAFDSHDRSWNADKIPDADRMIRSCHGLVVRDTEYDNVRLAHHTVQQYLVSAPGRLPDTNTRLEAFQESMAPTTGLSFWPELDRLRCDPNSAEVLAGTLCLTYLCFSDFSTAVSRIRDDRKIDLSAAFKDRGPFSIPAALGLGKHFGSLPYRFFGNRNNFKMPDIDYSKYLDVGPRDRRPSPDFQKKFALLEYVIDYWPWHTRWLESDSGQATQFWDLVQHGTLAFEFRPWGSRQHFGQYGCKGCPVPESDDLDPKDLPSMGLLHWAAETGHRKVFDIIKPPLQKYLKHERYHDETLLIACRHGQAAVVDILLDRGTFDLSDGRAIVAACASGNASIFHRLMEAQEAKSELNRSRDYFKSVGPRALYQAASMGHKDLVEILFSMKAEPFISDSTTGLTPLQIAAKNGHSEVIRELLSQNPNMEPRYFIDIPHETNGMSALHYAAENGFDEIVTFMVTEHGWDCDAQDSLGGTPLIKAARNGKATVVETLLEGGADSSRRGGENYNLGFSQFFFETYEFKQEINVRPTAVHHAAVNGHENVIAVLPYSDQTYGSRAATALHLGAAYGYPNVVQTLLLKGAEIEKKDFGGMTALHHASYYGHTAVVRLLLKNGCEPDMQTTEKLTALHIAAYSARNEVIKLLIAHGAATGRKTGPITIPGLGGGTPLHLAAGNADAETIRTLVDCGASLEDKTKYGMTPLNLAITSKNVANVLALIELGADWCREYVLYNAFTSTDFKIAEALLNKVSTSTRAEQSLAIRIIDELMKGEAFRKKLDDRTKQWIEEWKGSRVRR